MDGQLARMCVNGHIVGRVMKETVRRAMVAIRNERMIFEAHDKTDYHGVPNNDVFTSADQKAQAIYLRMVEECFPTCGIIAEEDHLARPAEGNSLYFTVDPLDGTKAFVRRQSHGVATMIALCDGTDVLAAYVGDINSDEVYGYRPDSNHVHRISRLDTFEQLSGEREEDLFDRYVVLRDKESKYSWTARRLARRFHGYEVMGSSIGWWAARLWKQEVGALLIPPGFETPWDSSPLIGISKKLGYVFLRPRGRWFGWEQYEPTLPTKLEMRDHDTLIVHESALAQVL